MALTLCISTAAAATTTQKNTTTTYKAAGSATITTVSSITVTVSQLNQASSNVKKFIETNKRLPNYVTIANKKITVAQYLYLASYGVTNLNSKKTSSVSVKTVNNPPSPSQTVKSGYIPKTEYVKVAGNLKKYMDTNKRLPNYAATSMGTMRYESLAYAYAKIIVFNRDNKRLPNTVSVSQWKVTATGSTSGEDVSQYLKSTAHAPSTNPTIKNLAASITKGKTTTLEKAKAIFNWVRDNLTYSFYYNSKKNATGALSSRTANCVDTSHLVVALARASGIAAKYRHAECYFYPDSDSSGGWFGHVWVNLYVDGKWYSADAINDKNSLGSIKNWDITNYRNKGTYADTPF